MGCLPAQDAESAMPRPCPHADLHDHEPVDLDPAGGLSGGGRSDDVCRDVAAGSQRLEQRGTERRDSADLVVSRRCRDGQKDAETFLAHGIASTSGRSRERSSTARSVESKLPMTRASE